MEGWEERIYQGQGRYWRDAGPICYLDHDGFMDRYMLKFTRQYTLGVGSLFVNYTTILSERSEDFGLA